MSDLPEKYIPSWCRDNKEVKSRTRLLKVERKDDFGVGDCLDIRDESGLQAFPLRIITPAYPNQLSRK